MNENQNEVELRAISITVLFLIFGVVLIWFTKKVMSIEDDTLVVSLLATTILVYMAASGKIEEFKGPGGFAAKFTRTANRRAHSETIGVYIEPTEVIMKGSVPDPQSTLNNLRSEYRDIPKNRPVVMGMELDGRNYRRDAVLQYIRILCQFRNFKLVVFRKGENYEGCMSLRAMQGLMSEPKLGDEFITVINKGDVEKLHEYPGVVKERLHPQNTNSEALREMERLDLEALVVIDDSGSLKSVIEREQVLSRMLLAPTKQV